MATNVVIMLRGTCYPKPLVPRWHVHDFYTQTHLCPCHFGFCGSKNSAGTYMHTDLVRCLLEAWTSISVLLNSFSSLRMAACVITNKSHLSASSSDVHSIMSQPSHVGRASRLLTQIRLLHKYIGFRNLERTTENKPLCALTELKTDHRCGVKICWGQLFVSYLVSCRQSCPGFVSSPVVVLGFGHLHVVTEADQNLSFS